MTREQIKSLFTIHTNGQDEWIRVDKRTYEKAIAKFVKYGEYVTIEVDTDDGTAIVKKA